MPIIKKQTPRLHSETKIFQCTGYGDCHMRFNRSEHLARHKRKHTGEKPFKCVTPGCERTFSRFDNMIQHTSTHGKHHDGNKEQGLHGNTKKKQQQGLKTNSRSSDNRSRLQESTRLSSPPYSISDPYTSLSTMEPSWSSISNDPLSPHSTFLPSPKQLGLHYGDPYLPPISCLDNELDDHGFSSSSSTTSSPSPISAPYSAMSPPPSCLGRIDDWMLPSPYLSGSHMYDLSNDEIQALQGMTKLSSQHHPVTVNLLPQQFRWTRESNSRFTPRSLPL